MDIVNVHVDKQQTVRFWLMNQDNAWVELPVTQVSNFTVSLLVGNPCRLVFGKDYTDEGELLLQCLRANVDCLSYANRWKEPIWVQHGREGQPVCLMPNGQFVLRWKPDPPLPAWQVSTTPEQERWQQKPLPDFLGLRSAPAGDRTIPWDRVSWYTEMDGRCFWFEWKDMLWGVAMEEAIFPYSEGDWLEKPCRFPAALLQELGQYTVAWQGNMDDYDIANRRPAVWMRGRPVTPEQALEIISGTDEYFLLTEFPYKGCPHLMRSWWFCPNHCPKMFGWCRPDGRIGLDGITGMTYPLGMEIVADGIALLRAFPYLDMTFLIWDCEEEFAFAPACLERDGMPQPACGMRISGRRIELLSPKTAWQTFCDYHARYGEDPVTYWTGYHEEAGKKWVDQDYLNRCLQARGEVPDCFWREEDYRLHRRTTDFAPEKMRYAELEKACAGRKA